MSLLSGGGKNQGWRKKSLSQHPIVLATFQKYMERLVTNVTSVEQEQHKLPYHLSCNRTLFYLLQAQKGRNKKTLCYPTLIQPRVPFLKLFPTPKSVTATIGSARHEYHLHRLARIVTEYHVPTVVRSASNANPTFARSVTP
jgi:hypothetical protein